MAKWMLNNEEANIELHRAGQLNIAVGVQPSQDISIILDKVKINCRACGIFINKNRLLLHKGDKDDFWGYIGGRIKTLESSEHAVIRECFEEMGVEVQINRLLCMVENFFEYNLEKFHEYLFMYLLDCNINNPIFEQEEFIGIDNGMTYRWFTFEQANELNIKPSFLDGKFDRLDELPQHIINDCLTEILDVGGAK